MVPTSSNKPQHPAPIDAGSIPIDEKGMTAQAVGTETGVASGLYAAAGAM
jgi:hypothetical protein